jgi:hypothetical protein
MTEISDFASIVLIVTSGFALAVLSTKLTARVPVPAPALFLLAAAVVSDIWPGVYEEVPDEEDAAQNDRGSGVGRGRRIGGNSRWRDGRTRRQRSRDPEPFNPDSQAHLRCAEVDSA